MSLPLVVAAACSDTTSPSTPAARSLSAAPAFDFSAGGRFHFGDSKTSFTVTPAGGSFAINSLLTVAFSAGSICDPAQSTYGVDEWDNDCVALTRPITITATTRLTSTGMAVDFQPDVRFAPDKEVTLSTDLFASTISSNRRFFGAAPGSLRVLAIYYSPTLGGSTVADYVGDSSVTTHIDLDAGRVWRRVKHFSGYVMGSGAACNVSAGDPDCVSVLSYTP